MESCNGQAEVGLEARDLKEPAAEETEQPADEVRLEPDDIVVLAVAAEKFKEDASLVHKPEFAFFKEFLLSWGAVLRNSPGGSAPAATDILDDPAPAAGKPPAAGGKPPAAVQLFDLDSDDDQMQMHEPEMDLPVGDLDDELLDEEERVEDGEKKVVEVKDLERLPKDTAPYPFLPPSNNSEPSDARKKVLARIKQEAMDALKGGNVARALNKYTEAIRSGGCTALMLATRAALLLKQRRPCAAIRDCCAAVMLNPDCGKAYHVRGVAHRKLGHWKKAHRDLSQGQRLDFSEDSVGVHMFVANKVGVMQDKKTGRWYQTEGAKKAVELLFSESQELGKDGKPRKKAPSVDLRPGQAVKIAGLQKAPHLNGRRGIVTRLNPRDHERWEVEVRLDRGLLEIKSIRGENITVVRTADAEAWKREEAQHAEDRRRREREEQRWKEEEAKRKRMDDRRTATDRSLRADGFPDMDASEKLEAEMSALPLEEEAMSLLRRLRAEEALEVLHQVGLGSLSNLSGYIKIKVRQRLGEPDSEDEDPPPPMWREDKPMEEDEENDDEDSEDEDFDRLPEEMEPLLDRGYTECEPTEEETAMLARWKREAAAALELSDSRTALHRYSDVISRGGATALMLTKRGELLLKVRRPCAAIKDCSAALDINPDLGKAYRIRGIARRKLGHWDEAHHDLAQGQRLDYDDGTAAVQKFVAERVRKGGERAAKAARRKHRGDPGDPPPLKRARAA